MTRLLTALALILFLTPVAFASDQSVADRVMASGTIRCGYFSWPPFTMKDPNTGKVSGLNYDVMEAIGRNLGLKIEWVSEVGVGDVATSLETNKFDVMCSTVWPSPARTKNLTLTLPTMYSVAFAYTRKDDKRFDGDLNKANKKEITITGIDGDFSQDLALEKLPNATHNRLAQTASGSELLLQVVSHKADIAFSDAGMVEEFMKNNPGSLRRVEGIPPVRYYGELLSVKRGEFHLKNMLDTSIMQLTNDGVIADLVAKYVKQYHLVSYPPSKGFVGQ